MPPRYAQRPRQLAPPAASYQPTIADVLQVKEFLGCPPISFPVELIDVLLDDADYWPHSTFVIDRSESVGLNISDKIWARTPTLVDLCCEGEVFEGDDEDPGIQSDEDLGIQSDVTRQLGALSLEHDPPGPPSGTSISNSSSHETGRVTASPRGSHPCRKIVFELWSHDQGYSHDTHLYGTYDHTWTWFEVSVEHSGEGYGGARAAEGKHPLHPRPGHLQRNVHAKSEDTHHVVAWHWRDRIMKGSAKAQELGMRGRGWRSGDGVIVRDFKKGDRLVLWMHARFPGWIGFWTVEGYMVTYQVEQVHQDDVRGDYEIMIRTLLRLLKIFPDLPPPHQFKDNASGKKMQTESRAGSKFERAAVQLNIRM
ncbi:hypothetical protein CONPUDRAFT_140813 [Coniophora puteana RWD-64-598 SS2]|uniref:Uncharacterized protein n=1 Tax=Coniophora puteana (strain RWD-64-598) TaxID=741705 RepID=A0A5M3N5A1_CONPW|nr:uncharacterized protein CONPUDRAFT_140813 [Coniophora puteana RWD-64-598 SS2]EIW86091.1 hypothetical protein CONPUDRAFT_140813 [Coniophora puteana RWD-64-598 SS2]